MASLPSPTRTTRSKRRCSTLGATTSRPRPHSSPATPPASHPRSAPSATQRRISPASYPPRAPPPGCRRLRGVRGARRGRGHRGIDDRISVFRLRRRLVYRCDVCFVQETGSDGDAHVLGDPKLQADCHRREQGVGYAGEDGAASRVQTYVAGFHGLALGVGNQRAIKTAFFIGKCL